ncbi:MAG TPA: dienelactone hydrolase family protein [Candidatus Binatia bacterium]|jgi:carboxymethylenebutenolidase
MQTTSERISIPVGGATMGAYLARPAEGGSHPAVLVFQEIFGVNQHIRSVADRVAAEGYIALAPELFHRTAPGLDVGYDAEGMQHGIACMNKAKASEVIADVSAALGTLQKRPDVKGRGIGAMGFCFGGHVTYLAACELPIAAAASFYGGGIAVGTPGNDGPPTIERTAKIKGRVLCLFGDQDGYIPPDQVEKIRAELTRHHIRHEIVVYPGVGHGFFCDARADYSKPAADDAWRRVRDLFREELR